MFVGPIQARLHFAVLGPLNGVVKLGHDVVLHSELQRLLLEESLEYSALRLPD